MPIALTARAPFEDLTFTTGANDVTGASDVVVTGCDGMGLATILVRAGQRALLAARLHELFAVELPFGPTRVGAGDLSIAGTGPESWLAMQRGGGNGFADSLKEKLAGLASVVDQSDGYAVLQLGGRRARSTLEKLVPIDVHARAFAVGAVAGTVAAHVGTLLWRSADDEHGHPTFGIAVPRSMAVSFWDALTHSAAEYGLTRR
jgi:sarcosine oxidase subunit gamma